MKITTLLAVLAALVLSGCGGALGWREEVELHDGQKIVVDRYQSYGGRHEFGQGAPVGSQTIRFTLPGKYWPLSFKSEYSDDVGRANLKIIALHILNDVPYIVTVPNLCLAYNKWGRPNPPYVIFKHDGKDWQRIPIAELPAEFKTINLAIDTKNEEERFRRDGVFSAEQVRKFNKELRQPEYQGLLREPITKWGWSGSAVSCERMVHYRCGWFGTRPDGTLNTEFADSMCNR